MRINVSTGLDSGQSILTLSSACSPRDLYRGGRGCHGVSGGVTFPKSLSHGVAGRNRHPAIGQGRLCETLVDTRYELGLLISLTAGRLTRPTQGSVDHKPVRRLPLTL
ncbi:hypothetical protein RRG08_014468 [Elysia crispata]|uniref:Uncharacterized protein n=1 Tax=Elysia crispata TaxID=231223 RepID=A0AAE0Y5M9_9GAST|nr:hypothetical protein RRG08_014468 [Elysia crispata]